jgi:dTDP-4-dehydrorhamnose 3,5-epimerase
MDQFTDGQIAGIIIRNLVKYTDERGWLTELFRIDDIAPKFHPQMAYMSVTLPGIARGPHEHVDQADFFCFIGPSNFRIYLWDNRQDSPTYRYKQTFVSGIDRPASVLIPKGVVHAYKNIGTEPGMVINCPNRLYRGEGRRSPIDEIRHEDDPDTIYRLD